MQAERTKDYDLPTEKFATIDDGAAWLRYAFGEGAAHSDLFTDFCELYGLRPAPLRAHLDGDVFRLLGYVFGYGDRAPE